MVQKELKIAYTEFENISEMDSMDKELVEASIEAMKLSYAPYSKFNVGAAVRMSDGSIIKGSNQENAAYPSGICAERTAMFYANSIAGDKTMTSIAIAASQDGTICTKPVSPCGACRQVMAEYQTKSGHNMRVLLHGSSKTMVFERVDDILPFIFDSL